MTVSDELRQRANELAAKTLNKHKMVIRGGPDRYSHAQETHYLNDTVFTINHLADSIRMGQPAFFESYVKWFSDFLPSINVPMYQMVQHFRVLETVIAEELGEEAKLAVRTSIQFSIDQIGKGTLIEGQDPDQSAMNTLAQEYLQLLLNGNRSGAVRLILHEVEGGRSIKDIYLNVFQATQYRIGKLWQTNRITVAQEHFVTAATQYAMSHLYPYIFKEKPGHRKLVSTCIQGELHELGARMVTDFFEIEGWDTNYLGANTPSGSIVSYINEQRPQLVAISATLMTNVAAVSDLIADIRNSTQHNYQPQIMVGGYPFRAVPDLWKQVGADAFAANAGEAINVASKLIT